MSEISRLDFLVLDAVADGSEPFSMIYEDVAQLEKPDWNLEAVVKSVFKLLAFEMLEPDEASSGEEFSLNCDTLLDHYRDVDRELDEVGAPFYYSKGEFFFQMTAAGREEWDKWEWVDL